MIASKLVKEETGTLPGRKFSDYLLLIKLRLSFLVVFSAAITYLYGIVYAGGTGFSWVNFLILTAGGFLVTGASNGINQIIEKDLDGLMDRTRDRPLPTLRMTVTEAIFATVIMGIAGIFLLYLLSPLTALLGAFSLLSYAFVYTPLKQVTAISVFIGAIPGAMPPILGWVAATGHLGMPALILFSIQFVWQFPHFWAIAWVLDDDYQKAGFRLLPSKEGRGKKSAIWILISTIILIPVSLLPTVFHMGGYVLAVVSLLAGLLFLIQAIRLYNTCTIKSASKLMFGSFIYLPLVQLALLIDKLF